MTSKVNVTKVWRFIGKTRRHEVELRHNTLSGKQLLSVNGEVLHKVNWKYKLTGNMYWELDGSICELYIRADEDGDIHYTLTTDNKEVPLTSDRVVSTWVVALADGLHQIEFEHASFDILVDGAKVESVGDFVDAGSAYSFDVGTAGAGAVAATLTVIPPPDRRTALRATLVCDGREVSQSESLGSAEADRIAAAEGGLPISGIGSTAAGRPEGHPGSFVKHGSFRIKS